MLRQLGFFLFLIIVVKGYAQSSVVPNSASQTITFAQPPSKTYGDVDFKLAASSSNPNIALTYSSDNTSVATVDNAGNVHITGAGSCTLTVSQPGNATYSVAKPVSHTLTVNRALLIVRPENKRIFYADPLPLFTFTFTGFVNSDDASVFTKPPIGATPATSASNVGFYPITASGAEAKNYDIKYNTGVLTINKITLVITAKDAARQYGQPNPPLQFSYSGFVNGDNSTSFNVKPTAATTVGTLSDPGTYPIIGSGVESLNYTPVYVAGTLTVTKADQQITFAALPPRAVGGADFSLTATASSGLPVTFTSSDPNTAEIINGNQVKILLAGTVNITATQAGNVDYNTASATRVLIINPPGVTIPNTFTPNNDGINDTWNIAGLEADATSVVNIYNRFGVSVFQSRGYPSPWTGYYKGKRLPAGVYFYVISVNNNVKRLSGNVTIVY
ncbi:MAG: gliding motility-associated C-terminal domain-containing protein [Bacteroidota bacterium]|nr:gliding motility-associated C-terminal domain-containing protein [Bacteroidota bacterium]